MRNVKTHKFELSAATQQAINNARDALESEVQEHLDELGERSARWQEGDKGVAVQEWIDTLNELTEALEGYAPEPE